MKSTKTRSITASSPTLGVLEAMKSGTELNVSGVCAVSSPTPGHAYIVTGEVLQTGQVSFQKKLHVRRA